MSGELQNSALIDDLMLAIKKLPSNLMQKVLINLTPFPIADIPQILLDLDNLLAARDPAASPLRSEHDIHHHTLRTTVVAQKVSLSHHTSALSPQDLAYSELVARVSAQLTQFLQTNLIDPRTLFLHEILIYDLKSPHRDVFTPKPRLAIERSLSSPHDYLGCDCCAGLDNALSPSQPPTAVLYQLYLECGAIINVADLWAAFYAVMGNEDSENEEADRERAL
jgi:origin recognition complex subunit 3